MEEDFNNSELENQNLYLKFTKNEIQASSQEYSRKELYVNCLREKIYPLLNLSKSMILKINLHDYHEQEGILTFLINWTSNWLNAKDAVQEISSGSWYEKSNSLSPVIKAWL